MTPTTLIFQDTGPKHTAMRKYMIKALAGLAKKDPGFQSDLLDVPIQEDPTLASDVLVKTGVFFSVFLFFELIYMYNLTHVFLFKPTGYTKSVHFSFCLFVFLFLTEIVRNLWYRIFKSAPTSDTLENLVKYYSLGGTCVLGETFHKVTMNSVLNKLDVVRAKAYDDAYSTNVGRQFYDNIKNELMFNDDEAKESLQQLVDGFMFAGMLGTTHLVTHTLSRIRARPDVYVATWKKNSHSFLLESARVDPPVTSVTAVLSEDQVVDIGIGKG